ncbi:spore coat protein [uncultured Ruthenibacterium sp.]|uniref:spore coat protein n=1 Tax=uncultured Ruthenibacterium sp. TaxID=1905347 RepID=UPI00349E4B5F
MNWTQKEKNFLKDLQNEEKLCVQKYHKAAEAACDPTLRHMLEKLENAEQNHCDTVAQMLDGKIPSQNTKQQNGRTLSAKQMKSNATRAQKQSDSYLLNDLLATEKYVSGVYNTAVFEFNDPAARQVLSAIQQQEQGHGKELAAYMQANGMSC